MRRNSQDVDLRSLARAASQGDQTAKTRLAWAYLRSGEDVLEAIRGVVPAPTPRRALAEAEYLLVEALFKQATPDAHDAFLDLLASRDNSKRWLVNVMRRKLIDKDWSIAALEYLNEPWPAATFEGGGYGFSDLKPEEEGYRRNSDYIDLIVIYAKHGELDHGERLMGPFYAEGRYRRDEDRPSPFISEEWFDVDDEPDIDEGMINSCDLETMANERGFEDVQDWVHDGLNNDTIERRAGFAAGLWRDIASYQGLGGDEESYDWPTIQKRYALEIVWENNGWLR